MAIRFKSPFPLRPPLSVSQILEWADTHFKCTGDWPTVNSGRVVGTRKEKWVNIDVNLRDGERGLPGEWSLAQLLSVHRGKRNPRALPPFTIEQILAWADAHHERTGKWPNHKSGPIGETGESWKGVQQALSLGRRGMPGGSSIFKLLQKRRKATHSRSRPKLSPNKILAWADAHHELTGNWPVHYSGPISTAPGETWQAIQQALKHGARGIKDKMSLAQLLFIRRGVPRHQRKTLLDLQQVQAWADAYRKRTGRWPTPMSGPIPEAPGETWSIIESALAQGRRGLGRPTSLIELLTGCPKEPFLRSRPLTEQQILGWADAYFKRHGRWPKK